MFEYLNDKIKIIKYNVDKWGERSVAYELETYSKKENIREMKANVEGREVLLSGGFLIKNDIDIEFGDEIESDGKKYKVVKIEEVKSLESFFKMVYVV